MIVVLCVLGWAVLAAVLVNVFHYLAVTKKRVRIAPTVWTAMLLSVFLPWSLMALSVLAWRVMFQRRGPK